MPVLFYLLINASISISFDPFPENIQSKNGWKIFGDAKITTPFSVEFSMHNVSTKSGNAIYKSYDLSKGNGLEISFKLSIKKESIFPRKKNSIQCFAVIFSKKLVKDWAELNDEKNDLIMLKFEPTKKNPEKFKHSIFQGFKGQINFSNIGNIHSGNLFCIQILNNKLFIYFNEENVRTIDVQEILEHDKIYVTMLSTLSRKLILNDFKTKTLSEAPEKECIYDGEYHNITLKVNGTKEENVSILFNEFSSLPDYIEINNTETNYELVNLVTLTESGITSIKLMWTKSFESCESMFRNCSSIISIDLSDFNNSLINNTKNMFNGCTSLETINFTNFNTSKIKDMDGMFSNCSKLGSIDLTNFDTSLVEDMSFMFANCSNLNSINLSSFNTNNVQYMDSMFSGCSKLKELNLSNFNTLSLVSMSKMFYRCESIVSIDLSNYNTINLKEFNQTFEECKSLVNIDLYDYKGKDIFESNLNYRFLTICIKSYKQINNGNNILVDKEVINKCAIITTIMTKLPIYKNYMSSNIKKSIFSNCSSMFTTNFKSTKISMNLFSSTIIIPNIELTNINSSTTSIS